MAENISRGGPLKVLLISSSSGSHGGGEFYLILLAQGLVDLGCDVTVLMSDSEHMNGLADKVVPVCTLRRIRLINTYQRKTRTIGSVIDQRQIRRIQRTIDELDPDVVHINKQCVDDGLGIVIAAAGSGVPTVATVHVTRSMQSLNSAMGWARDRVSAFVMRRASAPVIAVSQQSCDDWKRLNAGSTTVAIPNGTTRVRLDGRDRLRKQWNIGSDKIVLGTVARIEEQKNPLFLPAVIAGLPANVHLVWIGDGRLRADLEAEIQRQGVGDRFHLLGWQDNAKDQICGFDVFVLPSLFEGFPFAILEAMSAGLPCVVSDVDGNGESVVHESTGLVLPVNDQHEWVRQLDRLIGDPGLRKMFGQAALDRFEQEYDLPVMARRTLDVYKSMLASKPRNK